MEEHVSEQIVANGTQNSGIRALKSNNHCAHWHVSETPSDTTSKADHGKP